MLPAFFAAVFDSVTCYILDRKLVSLVWDRDKKNKEPFQNEIVFRLPNDYWGVRKFGEGLVFFFFAREDWGDY